MAVVAVNDDPFVKGIHTLLSLNINHHLHYSSSPDNIIATKKGTKVKALRSLFVSSLSAAILLRDTPRKHPHYMAIIM